MEISYESGVFVFVSWILLLFGLALFGWYFVIRGRGSFRYWIRQFEVEEQVVLGNFFSIDDLEGQQQFFTDANGVVRSLGRRTSSVVREWSEGGERLFLGLVLNSGPDEEVPEGYELRVFKRREVVRLSGVNRRDEENEVDAAKRYAKKQKLVLDFANPIRLSGQSFSLYQWDVKSAEVKRETSMLARWVEATYQLKNNVVVPVIATWVAVALMGTGQGLLLVIGILLICFLSGACKFVFIHQMTDEADEIHLQNY